MKKEEQNRINEIVSAEYRKFQAEKLFRRGMGKRFLLHPQKLQYNRSNH